MAIEVCNLTKTKINRKLLEKTAEAVFGKIKTQKNNLSVVIVGPRLVRELNKKYRNKTYVPNVLSFDYGEIVLCPEKIRQDVAKYGILFEQELVRVFTHGLLHLAGYSHKAMETTYKDFA